MKKGFTLVFHEIELKKKSGKEKQTISIYEPPDSKAGSSP